jgi:hypothetical protein
LAFHWEYFHKSNYSHCLVAHYLSQYYHFASINFTQAVISSDFWFAISARWDIASTVAFLRLSRSMMPASHRRQDIRHRLPAGLAWQRRRRAGIWSQRNAKHRNSLWRLSSLATARADGSWPRSARGYS